MAEGIPPLKILKVPEENIYNGPEEDSQEVKDEMADVVEKLRARNREIRDRIQVIEDEAAHPVPGAMKQNYEPEVIALESELRKGEADMKIRDLRAQLANLENEAAHPVPGAMKNPNLEAQILALEDQIVKLEKSKDPKVEEKAETIKGESETAPEPMPASAVAPEPAREQKEKEPKAEEPKEELPLAVPVGAPYVPEGVKTNAQLKKEFVDAKEKPKQEVDPLAQRPGESMRDFLNRRVGQRNSELEAELAARPWTTAGVINWWKERAEEYNTFSFGDKLITGGMMLGAAVAVGALTGSALAALGVAMPWRAFKGVAAGLGTYGLSEALIERSKQKKIAKGIEPGAIARNKKKVSTIIGATVGTIVGTGALGWLSHLFGGEEHAVDAAGKALEHHFDPNATVEVKHGHGAISLVHDLQMKLEHLYEHADPNTIPPAAAAIMHGDPTKIAEQLQAYQPDAFKNSELIARHAHLGIGSDGTLLYEAHGLDHPVTLMNADGTTAAGWNDHMMHPGEHHAPMSPLEKEVVAKAEAAAAAPISPEEAAQVAHDAATNTVGSEAIVQHGSLSELWAGHPDSSTLEALKGAANNMPVDQGLVSSAISGDISEPTAYLLQDGRISIFGVVNGSEAAKAATHFAAAMDTNVVLPIDRGGQLLDMIVHPDGTAETIVPQSQTPLVEKIVMKLGHP